MDMKARVGTRGSSVLGGADDLKTLGRSSMLMGGTREAQEPQEMQESWTKPVETHNNLVLPPQACQ